MSLAFVPLYVRYLGIESYGLIGLYASLQVWLGLLDMGMKPTLSREIARHSASSTDTQTIWDLMRSVEVISILVALLVSLSVWSCSHWLATEWVNAQKLPTSTVVHAFALMGLVAALQFIEGIYTSCLNGLQRQVSLNVITSAMATLRGLGAVGVLVWVSPSVVAFFVWQGAISAFSALLCGVMVYRSMVPSPSSPRFSMRPLLDVWRYAAGMLGISLLSLLLTQVDKVLLSRLLSLEDFGYYVFAGLVSGALYALTSPISLAYFPKFVGVVEKGDASRLIGLFHQASQLVSVVVGSAAVVLIVFGDRILTLWTNDPLMVVQVYPLMKIVLLGTLLNVLMWVPYQLQLAHGWTSLVIKINLAAVVILVPCILIAVPIYGSIGAAWIWVVLNAGYVLLGIFFMHRKLLVSEKIRWYGQDVLLPLAVAFSAAYLARNLLPAPESRFDELAALAFISLMVLCLTALAAHRIRESLMFHFRP
jgi:O-antigen/teichoic acid export membrane protein